MKRIFTLILIGAFLFPLTGHAAVAPATTQTGAVQSPAVDPIDLNNPTLQGKNLGAKKAIVLKGLQDILTQLTSLSAQTQVTIGQLSATGVNTTGAQTALISANANLAKAKTDITAFSGITISSVKSPTLTLNTLKYTANTAENTFQEAKAHIIDSLNSLKASLPSLDTDN